MTRLTTAQRSSLYGAPGETLNHATVLTPWAIKVRCHKAVLNVFAAACNEASKTSRWVPHRIDSFAHRNIRGSVSVSLHSWALAWDFFSTGIGVPPPGGVWRPDNTVTPEFAKPFTDRGFTWGATFTREDWPHIEWAGALPVVTAPTPQEDEMALVDVLRDPETPDGVWALLEDGTVRAFRGARDLGQPKGHDFWGDRRAKQFVPTDRGYEVMATTGERYGFPLGQ